jgi:hypothetical protein
VAPIAKVQWRTGFEDQIAACSLSSDNRIQVYDICRPYIPLYTLDRHENSVTSFLWYDADTIYSCSKDSMFAKTKISVHATKPVEWLNDSTVSWDHQDNLMFSFGLSGDFRAKFYEVSKRSSVFNNRWNDKVHFN